jgi:hypothetical protein
MLNDFNYTTISDYCQEKFLTLCAGNGKNIRISRESHRLIQGNQNAH